MSRSVMNVVGAAALMLCVLGGCKKSEGGSASAPATGGTKSSGKSEYVFGVIAKSQANPVFQAARTGAEDAAKELSAKHGVKVTVNWRTPNTEDAQKQAQFIEQLVAQGVNGITVSCTDAAILTGAIDDAVNKGVYVATFDSDAPASKRFAYYGINDEEAGRAVARELIKVMGETGVVAILAGNQSAPNLQTRVRGVRDEISKHPGVTIKDVYYHPETAPDAAAKVKDVQINNPEITGWAMVGGWPLFTENALDGVAGKAKVVSVDHLPEQLNYVRAGQVQALVGQDCYGWGYRTVEMLFERAHLNKSPENVINTFELSVVTSENVDEYAGIWNRWLGKK
ncbi:MAG: substrate-binding domain-containing protein [Phycisphaeraceae bacterium]|nr:MAG: substrate-binding domain-containing protein [Phycisphaeraceae bacterium]